MKTTTELDEVKNRLPSYLTRHHGGNIVKQSDTQITARCMLHDDRSPSFAADTHTGQWLFHCHGCGAGGSVFDLHAAEHGLAARSRENLVATAKAVGVALDAGELTDEEKRQWGRDQRKRERAARMAKAQQAKAERVTDHLQSRLCRELEPYHVIDWQASLFHSSPAILDYPENDGKLFISSLFNPDEVLWLGEPMDSGHAKHARNFRRCGDWLEADELPGRIAAGTFTKGCTSRSLKTVKSSPYVVIESDDLIGWKPTSPEEKNLNKSMSAALFGYLIAELGMTPRAAIDSGNKSLHLWMDRPPPDDFKALLTLADGLRIDRHLLENCQASPLRMPNCQHEKTGNLARIIYLNPKLS